MPCVKYSRASAAMTVQIEYPRLTMPAGIESAKPAPDEFADSVVGWFEIHGRHGLPWQTSPSPYRIWVSEIMLQQTRVATVIPYFLRFMERFPDVDTLAAADIDRILHLWTGLGYYARARNLHQAARTIVEEYGGEFPDTVEELERLSGIGRSTAGAILALAHGRSAPILDGNVKRVLARCFAVGGYPENSKTRSELWTLAERLLPRQLDESRAGSTQNRIAAYTQGMMDLGATLCTRANPDCSRCPLRGRCLARKCGEIERYPGRKPAKTLPVRSVTMFIMQDRKGRVLLEKRPPDGVWGSLYSFPQLDTDIGTPTAASEHAGMRHTPPPRHELPAGLPAVQFEDARPLALAPIRHGFTHFQLDIRPVHHMVVRTLATVADSDRWLWYSIADPEEVGLAAPVKKLLAALAATKIQRPGSSTNGEKP